MADHLVDAHAIAERLSVPVSWVREATRAGQLPAVAIGKYRRYDLDDVMRWVAEQKTGGGPRQSRRHRPVAS